jgi:flagellar P-ring protein precursor FlgI
MGPRVKPLKPRGPMRRPVRLFSAVLLAAAMMGGPALAKSRIKDIVEFEGVRENMLVGYGIVVGLNGTGDSLRNAPFTKQSLEAMLERLGVNTRDATLNTKNVAAVMVTGRLPAFAATGSQIDASVSAMGDAKSLLGGTLLVTPLLGADGQAYAVAQGTVQTGAVSASGASGSSVSKGVPTAGRIASGAIVEREIGFQLAKMDQLRMTLRNPDFTTAQRISAAVNAKFPGSALAENPTIVAIRPPPGPRHGQLRGGRGKPLRGPRRRRQGGDR